MHKRVCLLALLFLAACASAEPAAPSEPTPEISETPTLAFSSNPFNDGIAARRNGDYARAAAAFQRVLNSKPDAALAADAQFRLAEAHYLLRDYARALPAFDAFLQQYPSSPRAASVKYFLADAYRGVKDYPNALTHLRAFREQTHALIGDTDAAIADLLVLAGDADGALKQYERALEDKMLAASTRINVLQRYADLHQARGEPALAARKFDDARALTGNARAQAELYLKAGDAYAAANQLDLARARWQSAISQTPEQPSAYKSLVNLLNRGGAVDDYQRGLVNYHAASYDAAIAAFQRELKTETERAGDAHYYVALAFARQKEHAQAVQQFDHLITDHSKDKRVVDAYFGKASAYLAQGRTDDAVSAYKKLAATLPDDARADDALLRAAQLLDRAKRYADAAEIYAQIQTKYSTRESAPEAIFGAGFAYYRLKDYSSAMARWQLLAQNYPKANHYPRALFWLGKAAQARGLKDDAKKYWTQAAAVTSEAGAHWSRAYYAWRAQDALAPTNINATDPRRYDLARYTLNDAAARAEFEKWLAAWSKGATCCALDDATRADARFQRGAELVTLDRTTEARVQFASLLSAKQDDAAALYALALYWQENNQFSLALDAAERIARLAPSLANAPRYMQALRYPTYYADIVVAEAKANNLDPLLYFALIRQESNFYAFATSSADARGLGQIIPPTARGIAQKLGVKNFSLDDLYLPFVSVKFGEWYFAQDLTRYQEPLYALAAYNAGGSRVERWKNVDVDLAVEEIDIAETAAYVRIVYANWKIYSQIYR